jgi:hypothetical protein
MGKEEEKYSHKLSLEVNTLTLCGLLVSVALFVEAALQGMLLLFWH